MNVSKRESLWASRSFQFVSNQCLARLAEVRFYRAECGDQLTHGISRDDPALVVLVLYVAGMLR